MKTIDLVEDQKYILDDGKQYIYRGKDGGKKFVFILCGGFGMKVYHKDTKEIKTL